MTSEQLQNYIRTHRKRAELTQDEIAFLLGSKSGAAISRHERFKQNPSLETLLAYEMLFRTPVRNLFSGVHHEVERKLKERVRLLVRKLTQSRQTRLTKKKLEILNGLLEEQSLQT